MANRSAAAKEAAKTRTQKAAGKKAVKTRELSAAGSNAAQTNKRKAVGQELADPKSLKKEQSTAAPPSPRSERWAWREGSVDPVEEHFELRYGSATDSGWNEWVPVARVGRPIERVFEVEFIINRATRKSKMFDEVVAELDFYLVTKGERDPWLYGQYHCGTAANVYSGVHWSFFNGDSNGSASGEAKE